MSLLEAKDPAGARKALQRALELEPGFAQAAEAKAALAELGESRKPPS
jgi:hypothetical protein